MFCFETLKPHPPSSWQEEVRTGWSRVGLSQEFSKVRLTGTGNPVAGDHSELQKGVKRGYQLEGPGRLRAEEKAQLQAGRPCSVSEGVPTAIRWTMQEKDPLQCVTEGAWNEPSSTIGSMAQTLQPYQTWAGCYTARNNLSFNLVSCMYRFSPALNCEPFFAPRPVSVILLSGRDSSQVSREAKKQLAHSQENPHGAGQMSKRKQMPGKPSYSILYHCITWGSVVRTQDAQGTWRGAGS